MIPTNTDVLIVGAGPTGLALAAVLQQAGIRHVLIDRLEHGLNTSRAAVIHAHTLDVLAHIRVVNELQSRGLRVANFGIRDRDQKLVDLHLASLPSPHSYLLVLPQDVTETVLAERLIQLGGAIHRGVTATSVEQDEAAARVKVLTDQGESFITARYVVGADGMRSVVREAAAIEFDGGSYDESFVLADVRMEWPLGIREVSLFFSPQGLVVVAPLPDGSYRVVATMKKASATPGIADIQALVDARGPTAPRARVEAVIWSSRFQIHHRVARTYRKGRLLVMGDAAHVHSPAGGQGMNTGLVDAVVLGQLLGDVIRGTRPEAALDHYEQLRRPAAIQVLGLAGRLTGIATVRGTIRRMLRNAVLRLLFAFPYARRRLLMNLSGLGRANLAVVPAEKLPHSVVATA